MIARVKKLAASLAVWTCLSSFALWAEADSTSARLCYLQLRAVEKKLRAYLHKRVLVFRKGGVSRYQIKFDDRGHPINESGSELDTRPNAILFVDLKLSSEHIAISGEAVALQPGILKPILSRRPQELRLVTCTLILDVPPDEMTFTQAIRLLCQVFLTREEFHQASFGQVPGFQ